MKTRQHWHPRLQEALTLLVGLALVGWGLSCGHIIPGPEPTEPKAQYLKTGDLQLVMTRLGTHPRRMVTAAERVSIRFFFDPELVDVRKADRYALWRLDPDLRIWKQMGSVKADGTPLQIQPEEGLHALRASVIFGDGGERLVPQVGDEPAVWLLVDRTPPSLVWIEPKDSARIDGVRKLALTWAANEAQFSLDPVRLEWSADRGTTWKPIATVTPANGHQTYTWRLPPDVCSDILVKVAATDLSGLEGSASVQLRYPGSLSAGMPLSSAGGGSVRETTAVGTPSERSADEGGPEALEGRDAIGTSGAAGAPPARAGEGAAMAGAAAGEGTAAETREASPGDATSGSEATLLTGAAGARPTEGSSGPLQLVPFERDFVRGGSDVTVHWTYEGKAPDATAPEATVTLELSGDGGQTWIPVGSAALVEGVIRWSVPSASEEQKLVRIVAVSPKGWKLVAGSERPFSIDSEPPRIALGALPSVVGPEVELPVALTDPGGSGVERVEAHVRPQGGSNWRLLDEEKVRIDGSSLAIDLAEFEEGTYELALRAFDRVGNASPSPLGDIEPGVSSDTSGARVMLALDRTPPAIRASRGASPWVSGFLGEAEVVVDWTEGLPPLVVHGSADEGRSWNEIGRWTTVSPDQTRFAFDVPGDVRAYSVRFSVADGVGNVGYAVVGPEKVSPPVRLKSFVSAKAYPAGTLQKIEWDLDPAAVPMASSLLVSVSHFVGGDGGWEQIYKVRPDAQCVWELPEADRQEHRIRVRLIKEEEILGEDISPPFTIVEEGTPIPVAVNISEDSLLYSRRAREQMERYFTLVASGDQPADSVELANLRNEIAEGFEKALETDAKNYHASYSYAQFLNRLDAARNGEEVRRLLEKTLEIQPAHAWALNDMGALAIRDGKLAEAQSYLSRAAALEASPVIQYNLGLALFYGEKPKEAREALSAALSLSSQGGVTEGEIYYYVVQCLAKEGDAQAARTLFDEKASTMPEELRADLSTTLR